MFARLISYPLILALLLALALTLARPSQGAGPETRYVVRAGDTLWAIATDRYAGDPRKAVWRIEQRNGLTGRPLEAGTVIYLPS
jgi:nucleoid-associated protein YgaU